MQFQATAFEFARQRGGGEVPERFQSATEQNNFVGLADVPSNAGNSFSEKRNGVHITKDEVAGNVREVTLIAMLNGKKAMRQESQRFRSPTEIIGKGNFVVVAQFVEEATFEGGRAQKGAVQIEERSDASLR